MNNYKIIDYFQSGSKDHWLSEIGRSDWSAGQYLYSLIKEDKLFGLVGEGARVLLLTDGDELISFCTYSPLDDIQPTDLTPWVGFVYTFPEHRGKRLCGLLLAYAEECARADGHARVHISTDHVGLYEKYGYSFLREMNDVNGEKSRVYVKSIK